MATQNEILLKANEVTTSVVGASNTSGILKPAQANRFIDFVVDQSVVMQNSRFVRMRTPDQDIDKLAVGTRLLAAATEVTDGSTNAVVTFSKVALTTKKMRLDWAISTESLEDNIEGVPQLAELRLIVFFVRFLQSFFSVVTSFGSLLDQTLFRTQFIA